MEYVSLIFSQFSPVSSGQYAAWYAALEKPFFAPEPFVFGIAWGIIYPLIAIALLWSIVLFLRGRMTSPFIALFVLNILLNLTFTPTVFYTADNTLISLHILLVLTTLGVLQVHAWKKSRVVFFLLLPYLLWGAFATLLQLSITIQNGI